MNKNILLRFLPLVLLLSTLWGLDDARAQLKEPEVKKQEAPMTPLSEGRPNGFDINIMLNNFGFGIGGEYTRAIGSFTELTLRTGITGIRDVSEQSFQDFFTGQRIIPNKYKRAIGFPILIGVERRLFARKIADNFRFFASGSAGPALAFVYPYVNDTDRNGLRTSFINRFGQIQFTETINDFFSGWKQGDTMWGATGEVKLGVAFGKEFKKQTTIEFGYMFYYFDQGIQIMEPRRIVSYSNEGFISETDEFFEPQKYFGTPEITISFGWMW